MKRFALTYKFIFSTALLFILIVGCKNDRDDYVPVPVIVSVQPEGASPGQAVNIFGGNFSESAAENIVSINGIAAIVSEAANNRLIIIVPDNATDGVLSVTVNGQTGVAKKLFDVNNELKITAITPPKASRLDTITVQGQYFGNTVAENTVKIKDVSATIVSANFTELKIIVPESAGAGQATISIGAHNQSVSSDDFEIVDYPPFSFENSVTTSAPDKLKKVSIASTNVAYAAGDEGVIMKSTAPGTWVDISHKVIPTGETAALDYRDVHAFDEQTALVCGGNGLLIKTTDGGTSWSTIAVGTAETLRRLYFISPNEGWLVGSEGVIFNTTDGGNSWQSQSSGTTERLLGVFFFDANTGFAVGETDQFLKTTDGGTTWVSTSLTTGVDLTSIVFKDANTGWITGKDNVLLATTDGGANWTDQSISLDSSGDDINDISILSSSNIIAVADDHQIIKSEDGGATWTIVDFEVTLGNNTPDSFDVHVDGIDSYRGKAIAVGEDEFIWY